MRFSSASIALVGLALAVLPCSVAGCMEGSGQLAQPFGGMTQAPITVFRLQNFEPQPQAAAGGANPLGIQIPPQIQQWIDAGAHMLPPGLIPPGLIPGSAAPAAQANAQRFHNFRVLGWMALNDPKLHDEVLDILGHEQNFVPQHGSCMYAEFGVSIAMPNGQPPADYLVSLSCSQVQSASPPPWPYPEAGIPPETAKRIVAVVGHAFGGG
jgi:hypothetical protein